LVGLPEIPAKISQPEAAKKKYPRIPRGANPESGELQTEKDVGIADVFSIALHTCRGSVASRRRPTKWVELRALQASHSRVGMHTTLTRNRPD